MRPDRRGVAGYLEVFILIAVAMGGAVLVMGAALGYFAAMGGGSVAVAGASIRQGPYSAVETLLVTDNSETALGSFEVTTSGAPSTASYCYSVYDTSDRAVLASSCPAAGSDPGSVRVATPLVPGATVLVEVVVSGAAFAVGSSHLVTVTAAGGAQQAVEVRVVPA